LRSVAYIQYEYTTLKKFILFLHFFFFFYGCRRYIDIQVSDMLVVYNTYCAAFYVIDFFETG